MSGYDDIAGWYDEAVREGPAPETLKVAGCAASPAVKGPLPEAWRIAPRVLGVDVSGRRPGIARLYDRKESRLPLMDL